MEILVRVVKFSLSSAVLVAVVLLADHAVFQWPPLQQRRVLRALTDNVTHGTVAGWCWANTVVFLGQPLNFHAVAQIGLSTLLGCVIDLDHFWEAKSLSLEVSKNDPNLARDF